MALSHTVDWKCHHLLFTTAEDKRVHRITSALSEPLNRLPRGTSCCWSLAQLYPPDQEEGAATAAARGLRWEAGTHS